MKIGNGWIIPSGGAVGLAAFLVTYSSLRAPEAQKGPDVLPSAREAAPPDPAGARASTEGLPRSAAVRPVGSGSSRALPPAFIRPTAAAAAHGPLGYLRDIPAGSGAAGRKEVILRTAEHLGVPEKSRADFEKAAEQVLLELEAASRIRREESNSLGLSGPGPRRAGSSEISHQLQLRSAARRAEALGRLDSFLDGSSAARDFRATFEAWVATAWFKGRGRP